MSHNIPIPFQLWIVALATQQIPLQIFIKWADLQIMETARPEYWIFDLSLARSRDEAIRVMSEEWSRRSSMPTEQNSRRILEAKLHVGFLFLQFEKGQLKMIDLLCQCGAYADGPGCGWVGVECEAFYLLANEIEGGGPTALSDCPLIERVNELFAPFADVARAAVADLPFSHSPG